MAATQEVLDRSSTTLAKALSEVFKGEILSDPFTRSLYATDASIYEIEPILVCYPMDELDVRGCLWFAQKNGVAVIARGGGSGLGGESLGQAIIMDLTVHMNRIVELDKEHNTVTVQTGLVLDSLNRALKPYGYRFGPDPSSGSRCTIGGMIANNASGARSLRFGDTRQNLVAARLCLMDGTVTLANPTRLDNKDYEDKKKEEGFSGRIHRELPGILQNNAAVIAAKKPKSERNACGYLLDGVLQDGVYDLPKLLCGSQGTLGVVSEAVLKVEPISGAYGVCIVYFASLVDAAKAAPLIRQTNPIACELLDQKLIELGRQAKPELSHLLPQDAGALLAVEYEAADETAVEALLESLKAKLQGVTHQSLKLVPEIKDQEDIWAIRAAATPLLFRRKDNLQPVPFVEDAAVPVEKLATYIEKAGVIFAKYKLEWTAYAHAGSGEVHLRPFMDLRRKEHLDLLEKVAGEVHAAAWECGGTISGEHSDGLVRSQWIEKQAGKDLYAVYKEIKELFDPSGLLNPNKKITKDAHLMLKNLRFGENYRFSTGEKPKNWSINPTQAVNWRMFKSQTSVRTEMTVEGFATNPHDVKYHGRSPLNWAGTEMADETERCNGCAHCKTTGPEEDMCPRFKFERIEDASPRAKANVLRRLMTGRQKQGTFSSDEVLEIMDTCYNCKLCHDGCPSHVNIPKIVLEAKARYHQAHGISIDKWVLMQCDRVCRVGQYVAPLVNMINEFAPYRFLLEKVTGLDRRRNIARIRPWKFRKSLVSSATSDRPRVVLYLDLYSRYSHPEIAQAAINVLEHNNIEVEIPDAPPVNLSALMNGAVLEARANGTAIGKALSPYAFKGMPILTLDASTCMSLQEDVLSYVDTPETRAVARHARDIGDFLLELYRCKKMKIDFQPVEAVFGYHQACHHKALHIGTPAVEILKHVPGVKIMQINQGCCGNPGNWGLIRKNYDESMYIGKGLFQELADEKNAIQYGLTEQASCKCQMEHGSSKTSLHPVQILAAAYGYADAQPRDDSWDKFESAPQPVHHEEPHAAVEGDAHADHDHHDGASATGTEHDETHEVAADHEEHGQDHGEHASHPEDSHGGHNEPGEHKHSHEHGHAQSH
ncbi:MAG TPA: FAD-linked oxidase C-terminal domain-containing protein [Planctomycetota bacterium]|nr:FAD-linked oxidase C-terminal domain-containing protein [Planctomycetota bacterium]